MVWPHTLSGVGGQARGGNERLGTGRWLLLKLTGEIMLLNVQPGVPGGGMALLLAAGIS